MTGKDKKRHGQPKTGTMPQKIKKAAAPFVYTVKQTYGWRHPGTDKRLRRFQEEAGRTLSETLRELFVIPKVSWICKSFVCLLVYTWSCLNTTGFVE